MIFVYILALNQFYSWLVKTCEDGCDISGHCQNEPEIYQNIHTSPIQTRIPKEPRTILRPGEKLTRRHGERGMQGNKYVQNKVWNHSWYEILVCKDVDVHYGGNQKTKTGNEKSGKKAC